MSLSPETAINILRIMDAHSYKNVDWVGFTLLQDRLCLCTQGAAALLTQVQPSPDCPFYTCLFIQSCSLLPPWLYLQCRGTLNTVRLLLLEKAYNTLSIGIGNGIEQCHLVSPRVVGPGALILSLTPWKGQTWILSDVYLGQFLHWTERNVQSILIMLLQHAF